jgi:hypothetical protein
MFLAEVILARFRDIVSQETIPRREMLLGTIFWVTVVILVLNHLIHLPKRGKL